jgi:hypothetical protein
MNFHTITNKFFVLDMPENLISSEAKEDSDLILHEYESVIPDIIKNLGNINLSSCFLNEKSECSNLINERRTFNNPRNKKDSSWRKFSDSEKKDDFDSRKGYSSSLKKVKEVEIKFIPDNKIFSNWVNIGNSKIIDDYNELQLCISNNEQFLISENKPLSNTVKTQNELGKIIGSIVKNNLKENLTKQNKHGGQSKKYKIQDLYKINQIYKLENSHNIWNVLCSFVNNNKNISSLNEFLMGPFSSECIVWFYKQGDITEETKLKIDKAIINEEKSNTRLFALLNNQQGIKIKNLLKALNPKEEASYKKKKPSTNLGYGAELQNEYYYDSSLNYPNYNQIPNSSNTSKSNPSKKFSYSRVSLNKKDSQDDSTSSNTRHNSMNYSDEYYYNKVMNNDDRK